MELRLRLRLKLSRMLMKGMCFIFRLQLYYDNICWDIASAGSDQSITRSRFPRKFEDAEDKYLCAKWQDMASKFPGSSCSREQWLLNFPDLPDSVSIDFWTSKFFSTCLRRKPYFKKKCKHPGNLFLAWQWVFLVQFWCCRYKRKVFSRIVTETIVQILKIIWVWIAISISNFSSRWKGRKKILPISLPDV